MAKGNLGALVLARGATGVNATMPTAERAVADVVTVLTRQLEASFLGAARARHLRQSARLVLRARVAEVAPGGRSYRVRTLWECELPGGREA